MRSLPYGRAMIGSVFGIGRPAPFVSAAALLFASWSVAAMAGDVLAWHRVRTPAQGVPLSIGGYSAGCIQGAKALALSGPGYQVMRPERRRHFGHPSLLQVVRALAQKAKAKTLGLVLIGDLGQPRGGPAPTGHASHQTGLDVDIWYASVLAPLSAAERKQASSPAVVDDVKLALNEHWQPRMAELLRIAAQDERVARVFVNPVIKRALCAQAVQDRGFLSKLRPWWGHDEHFHVRLACPPDSPLCEPQAAIAAGDGCAELSEWLSPEAQAAREKEHARYRAKIGSAPVLPLACGALLESR